MSMIIPEFGSLELNRTNPQHFGNGAIQSMDSISGVSRVTSLNNVSGISGVSNTSSVSETHKSGKTFQSYLMDAINTVNDQQMDVTKLQEKLITSPDEVDIHDVTIAMSKARMSLNLAQSVIDRMITGWNEITTTR